MALSKDELWLASTRWCVKIGAHVFHGVIRQVLEMIIVNRYTAQ